MRFYLAASSCRQKEMREVRNVLNSLGHQVTSSWLDDPDLGANNPGDADRDTKEILASDILIQETEPVTGGKNCEIGICIIAGKVFWTVGKFNNPFQWKASSMFDTWDEVFHLLKTLPIEIDLTKEAAC